MPYASSSQWLGASVLLQLSLNENVMRQTCSFSEETVRHQGVGCLACPACHACGPCRDPDRGPCPARAPGAAARAGASLAAAAACASGGPAQTARCSTAHSSWCTCSHATARLPSGVPAGKAAEFASPQHGLLLHATLHQVLHDATNIAGEKSTGINSCTCYKLYLRGRKFQVQKQCGPVWQQGVMAASEDLLLT